MLLHQPHLTIRSRNTVFTLISSLPVDLGLGEQSPWKGRGIEEAITALLLFMSSQTGRISIKVIVRMEVKVRMRDYLGRKWV